MTTLGLLPEFDQRPNIALRFDASDIPALQEDRNARAAWVVQMVNGGSMSVHRAHLELGLPEPEGEDFYLRTLAQDAVPANDPLWLKKPKPVMPPALVPPNGTAPPDDDEDEDEDERSAVLWSSAPALSEWAKRSGVPAPTIRRLLLNGHGPAERRAAIGQHNRAMIGRVADRAEPAYRAFFRAQGRRIVSASTRGVSSWQTTIDWAVRQRGLITENPQELYRQIPELAICLKSIGTKRSGVCSRSSPATTNSPARRPSPR